MIFREKQDHPKRNGPYSSFFHLSSLKPDFKPASPFHRPRAACCPEDNRPYGRPCSRDTGERASCRQSAGQSATSPHPGRMRSIGPADLSCEIDNTFHRRISWILSLVMIGNEIFSKGPGDKVTSGPFRTAGKASQDRQMASPPLAPAVRAGETSAEMSIPDPPWTRPRSLRHAIP